MLPAKRLFDDESARVSGLKFVACMGAWVMLTGASGSKPREIIIETPAPSQGAKPAPVLSDLERKAVDNALMAGAVETESPVRATRNSRKVEQEFQVRNGRCYYLSVAWRENYRVTLTYNLLRTVDGRPLNEFVSSESGISYPGEGIVQFCVDRSGTVRLELQADESAGPADTYREYVMVVGSRPELPTQVDARRRRAAARKQAAEASKQTTPATTPTSAK